MLSRVALNYQAVDHSCPRLILKYLCAHVAQAGGVHTLYSVIIRSEQELTGKIRVSVP
jgi:hypothetical protein